MTNVLRFSTRHAKQKPYHVPNVKDDGFAKDTHNSMAHKRKWTLLHHSLKICACLNVMWSSKMSGNSQILFLRYSQTKQIISFVSYCLSNPSTVCIFGTNCPKSMGFCQIKAFNTLIENAKKRKKIIFFDFRLILLDRITNVTQQHQMRQVLAITILNYLNRCEQCQLNNRHIWSAFFRGYKALYANICTHSKRQICINLHKKFQTVK